MKKETIALAVLIGMLLLLLPITEAKLTNIEIWNQRLFSSIHFSPARLKNFCLSYDVSKVYQNKVCRTTNQDCSDFLEEKQDEWCNEIIGDGIRDFNSRLNFQAMREYLREHRLPLLTRHEETTTTIPEEITTTTTTTIEAASSQSGGRKRLMRII